MRRTKQPVSGFVTLMAGTMLLLGAISPGSILASGVPASANPPLPSLQAIHLIPGTVATSTEIEQAVVAALAKGPVEQADAYAVTDTRPLDGRLFISVVGLDGLANAQTWNIQDNGVWFGLLLLEQSPDQIWVGAVRGTEAFAAQIEAIPDRLLSATAKADLDSTRKPSGLQSPASLYAFPWAPGTQMYYGAEGVHDNGFPSVVSGWKAVDFLSDGNTAAGHAPNSLRASQTGTISYQCTPSAGATSTAIRVGDLMYTHLLNSASLYVGRSFSQFQEIGQLKTGSFSENCGWASQGSNWFHVHWGFPNTGSLGAGGWTLTFTDQAWRRAGETKVIGDWFDADGTGLSFTIFARDPVNYGRIISPTPVHPQRPLSVDIYNLAGQLAYAGQTMVQYDSGADIYTGSLDLGTGWSTDVYIVKAHLDFTLRETVATLAITNGNRYNIGPAGLRVGDTNRDGKIDITDYNNIVDCFSDLGPPKNCADPIKKQGADLNDDGHVNGTDYNTWMRVISIQRGS